MGIRRDMAFCLGQGKNYAFLRHVNEEKGYFKERIPLPHLRWVMQYQLKKKDVYIDDIAQKLREA